MFYKPLDFTGYPNYRISNEGTIDRFVGGNWRPLKLQVTQTDNHVHLANKGSDKNFAVSYLYYSAWTGDVKPYNEYRVVAKNGNKRDYFIDNFTLVKRSKKYTPKEKPIPESVVTPTPVKIEEEYRSLDFTGFKGYRISNTGKISAYYRSGDWNTMSLNNTTHNCQYIQLSQKGISKTFKVSYLFYCAFTGDIKPYTCRKGEYKLIAKDGNHRNYTLSNFYWGKGKPKDKIKLPKPVRTFLPVGDDHKSLDFTGCFGYRISKDGKISSCRTGEWKELNFHVSNRRPRVSMHTGQKGATKNKLFTVHQLWYEAWNPVKDPKPSEWHYLKALDGNYSNFKLDNFQWDIKVCAKVKTTKEVTPQDVKDIRTLYNDGTYTVNELSSLLNLNHPIVCNILNNKTHHDPNYKRTRFFNLNKTSEDTKKSIQFLYFTGEYSKEQLVEKFNLSLSTINRIIKEGQEE